MDLEITCDGHCHLVLQTNVEIQITVCEKERSEMGERVEKLAIFAKQPSPHSPKESVVKGATYIRYF